MIKCVFKDEEIIVTEDDNGNSIFVIKEGSVQCIKYSQQIRELYKGDYFGEYSTLFDTYRTMTISAISPIVECYMISKHNLQESLGEDYKQIILTAIAKHVLKEKSFLIWNLSFSDNFKEIFKILKLCIWNNYETVIKSGMNTDKKMIIIVEGSLIRVI